MVRSLYPSRTSPRHRSSTPTAPEVAIRIGLLRVEGGVHALERSERGSFGRKTSTTTLPTTMASQLPSVSMVNMVALGG